MPIDVLEKIRKVYRTFSRGIITKLSDRDSPDESLSNCVGFNLGIKPGALVKDFGSSPFFSANSLPSGIAKVWGIGSFRVESLNEEFICIVGSKLNESRFRFFIRKFFNSRWSPSLFDNWIELTETHLARITTKVNNSNFRFSALPATSDGYFNGFTVWNTDRGQYGYITAYTDSTKQCRVDGSFPSWRGPAVIPGGVNRLDPMGDAIPSQLNLWRTSLGLGTPGALRDAIDDGEFPLWGEDDPYIQLVSQTGMFESITLPPTSTTDEITFELTNPVGVRDPDGRTTVTVIANGMYLISSAILQIQLLELIENNISLVASRTYSVTNTGPIQYTFHTANSGIINPSNLRIRIIGTVPDTFSRGRTDPPLHPDSIASGESLTPGGRIIVHHIKVSIDVTGGDSPGDQCVFYRFPDTRHLGLDQPRDITKPFVFFNNTKEVITMGYTGRQAKERPLLVEYIKDRKFFSSQVSGFIAPRVDQMYFTREIPAYKDLIELGIVIETADEVLTGAIVPSADRDSDAGWVTTPRNVSRFSTLDEGITPDDTDYVEWHGTIPAGNTVALKFTLPISALPRRGFLSVFIRLADIESTELPVGRLILREENSGTEIQSSPFFYFSEFYTRVETFSMTAFSNVAVNTGDFTITFRQQPHGVDASRRIRVTNLFATHSLVAGTNEKLLRAIFVPIFNEYLIGQPIYDTFYYLATARPSYYLRPKVNFANMDKRLTRLLVFTDDSKLDKKYDEFLSAFDFRFTESGFNERDSKPFQIIRNWEMDGNLYAAENAHPSSVSKPKRIETGRQTADLIKLTDYLGYPLGGVLKTIDVNWRYQAKTSLKDQALLVVDESDDVLRTSYYDSENIHNDHSFPQVARDNSGNALMFFLSIKGKLLGILGRYGKIYAFKETGYEIINVASGQSVVVQADIIAPLGIIDTSIGIVYAGARSISVLPLHGGLSEPISEAIEEEYGSIPDIYKSQMVATEVPDLGLIMFSMQDSDVLTELTGTATAKETTIIGIGTLFTTELVPGDYIKLFDITARVKVITNNNLMTVDRAITPSTDAPPATLIFKRTATFVQYCYYPMQGGGIWWKRRFVYAPSYFRKMLDNTVIFAATAPLTNIARLLQYPDRTTYKDDGADPSWIVETQWLSLDFDDVRKVLRTIIMMVRADGVKKFEIVIYLDRSTTIYQTIPMTTVNGVTDLRAVVKPPGHFKEIKIIVKPLTGETGATAPQRLELEEIRMYGETSSGTEAD